jgi:hypothetical protein
MSPQGWGGEGDTLLKIITKAERTGGVAQVVECLPSKCKGPEFKPQYSWVEVGGREERKNRNVPLRKVNGLAECLKQ